MKFINCENGLTSGIYAIKNIYNESVYIGCTTRPFFTRFIDHQTDLSKNRSRNKLLQNDWNDYGEDAFEFIVIEVIDKHKVDMIYIREEYWIKNYEKIGKRRYNNKHTSSCRYLINDIITTCVDDVVIEIPIAKCVVEIERGHCPKTRLRRLMTAQCWKVGNSLYELSQQVKELD